MPPHLVGPAAVTAAIGIAPHPGETPASTERPPGAEALPSVDRSPVDKSALVAPPKLTAEVPTRATHPQGSTASVTWPRDRETRVHSAASAGSSVLHRTAPTANVVVPANGSRMVPASPTPTRTIQVQAHAQKPPAVHHAKKAETKLRNEEL